MGRNVKEYGCEEVKERIINAAIKVFSIYGYSKTPVHLIADEAGVSKGLVFWYFNSKDKLIKEVGVRALPIDIINLCLTKNIEKEELLRCIASRYLDKYSNISMRRLLLHTMAAASVYSEIRNRVDLMCKEMLEDISKKVFGDSSHKSRIKMRMFFGSLLCYAATLPKDIKKDEYIEIVVNNVLKHYE